MDPVEYWRAVAQSNEARVNAACEATGAAEFYLGPYCHLSDHERLATLRDLFIDLRRALGLATPDTTPGTTSGTAAVHVPVQKGHEN